MTPLLCRVALKALTTAALGSAAAIVVLVAAVAMGRSASAASFDCRKAASSVERTICSSEPLSDADALLHSVFTAALTSSRDARHLKADQLHWIRTRRDPCRDEACMLSAYEARIVELDSSLSVEIAPRPLTLFEHLRTFELKDPDAVLKDKVLRPAIRRVAGKYFPVLASNLNASSGVTVDSEGGLNIEGCIPHACVIGGGDIYIRPTGQIYVALLINGNLVMYFTNDRDNRTTLVEPIRKFVDNLKRPPGLPEEATRVKVVFMNK